jgi:hypothetical protein
MSESERQREGGEEAEQRERERGYGNRETFSHRVGNTPSHDSLPFPPSLSVPFAALASLGLYASLSLSV